MLASLRARMLPRAFFERDARAVARALIGTCIVHVISPEKYRVARIVETEAYRGPKDAASHARFGMTPRNRAIFGTPGTAYCFLVYGMHDCFNVVTREEGSGHAVLIRGAEPVFGVDERADGPGKFSRALGFSRKDNARDCVTPELFFVARESRVVVTVGARIGVAYAGDHADFALRFFDAKSKHVSRPPASQIGRGVVTAKKITAPTSASETRRNARSHSPKK